MGIYVGGHKEVVAYSIGKRVVSAIYAGSRLVWLAVSSCFGAGYWIRTKGWSRKEAWRRKSR